MSGKIELSFDYIDGKHVPTIKILLDPCGPDDSQAWDARDLLGKRMKELLAAPVVERQPVAWSYCPECGCEDLHHEQGEHKQCANCYQEWFSDIDYSEVVRGNLEKLKASPPAPVAVVLPERMTFNGDEPEPKSISYDVAAGWNACLDKVKELNQ